MIQSEREEILSCTAEDIRKFADILKIAVTQGIHCTFGNEKAVKEEEELFSEIRYALK